jgi:hypothetical protein
LSIAPTSPNDKDSHCTELKFGYSLNDVDCADFNCPRFTASDKSVPSFKFVIFYPIAFIWESSLTMNSVFDSDEEITPSTRSC